MAWYKSDKKLTEALSNLVLLGVVVVSWTYVILGGLHVSKRYLSRLDLSQFAGDERMSHVFDDPEE